MKDAGGGGAAWANNDYDFGGEGGDSYSVHIDPKGNPEFNGEDGLIDGNKILRALEALDNIAGTPDGQAMFDALKANGNRITLSDITGFRNSNNEPLHSMVDVEGDLEGHLPPSGTDVRIAIDFNDLNETYNSPEGKVKFTLEHIIAHEVMHAFTGLKDPSKKGESNEFLEKVNKLLDQLTEKGLFNPHRLGLPIVFDLDGDGLELTDATTSTAFFDYDDDGKLDRTGWATGGDGLLVYDYQGDGVVTKANEIVFTGYLPGAETDLQGLRGLDSNKDGKLDATDENWDKFKIWIDRNNDGKSDQGEMVLLASLGIVFLNLTANPNSFDIENSNIVFGTVTYGKDDGTTGIAGDVGFGVTAYQDWQNATVTGAQAPGPTDVPRSEIVVSADDIVSGSASQETLQGEVAYDEATLGPSPASAGLPNAGGHFPGVPYSGQDGGLGGTSAGGVPDPLPTTNNSGGVLGDLGPLIDDGEFGLPTGLSDDASNPFFLNTAPLAPGLSGIALAEDSPRVFTAAELLQGASDAEGDDGLRVAAITGVKGGMASLLPDGSVRFVPDPDYVGPASFTYRVEDGRGGAVEASVSLTITAINDAPLAGEDRFTLFEDQGFSVTIDELLANDRDVEDRILTFERIVTVSGGTVRVEADGTIRFTPDADYHGLASFTYLVRDSDGAVSEGRVVLNILPVDDGPGAKPDVLSVAEDSFLLADPTDLVANDSDPEGDGFTLVSVGSAIHGTVSLTAEGKILFRADADYSGPASFTYVIRDAGGQYSTATVLVNVIAVNDLPVAGDDAAVGVEDRNLTLTLARLLGNDSDADGDVLTLERIENVVGGGVSRNAAGDVVFTPGANYFGTAGFDYWIRDGQGGLARGHVNLTITPVNDAPIARGDLVTVAEDAILNLQAASLLANDSDVEGDPLSLTRVGNAINGVVERLADGSVRFTPFKDFVGVATFDYWVSDGQGGESRATVAVTVTPVNDAPVAPNLTAQSIDEDHGLSLPVAALLDRVLDVDNGRGDFTLVSVSGAIGGSIRIENGQVLFAPQVNYHGAAGFDYTVSDGAGGYATGHLDFTILSINDAPIVTGEIIHATEDDILIVTPTDLLANDRDVDAATDGDVLSITWVGEAVHGSVSFNAQGQIVFVSEADYFGTDAGFHYRVEDGKGGVTDGWVSVLLDARQDAPITGNDFIQAQEDVGQIIAVADLLRNDRDADGDSLTLISVKNATGGIVTLTQDGRILFDPTRDYYGAAGFDYEVTDGHGNTSTGHVDINLAPVNDAPRPYWDYHNGGLIIPGDPDDPAPSMRYWVSQDGAIVDFWVSWSNNDAHYGYERYVKWLGEGASETFYDRFTTAVQDPHGAIGYITLTVLVTVYGENRPGNDHRQNGGAISLTDALESGEAKVLSAAYDWDGDGVAEQTDIFSDTTGLVSAADVLRQWHHSFLPLAA